MTPTKGRLTFWLANAGTVFVFCQLTSRAKEWVDENVELEVYQCFGNGLVVDHGFAWGLGQGMKDAGLVLE